MWAVDDELPPGRVTGLTAGADGHVWTLVANPDPEGEPTFEVRRFDGEVWVTEATAADLRGGMMSRRVT